MAMAFPDAVLLRSSVFNHSAPFASAATTSIPSISSFCSIPSNPKPFGFDGFSTSFGSGRFGTSPRVPLLICNARKSSKEAPPKAEEPQEVEQEEEVELSWVEEKVEDLQQFTSSAVRAIPGPRVGDGELPWLLALPIGYVTVSLVVAVVKTVRRYTSREGKRRRQIGKNAWLVATLGEYLPAKRDQLDSKTLNDIAKKCQFDTEEALRKYIRYALNERPFDPELVADLIHLRKASMLDDETVAEILNEVSRRIVKQKGVVVMDTTGFTERGLKRKVAVQALFSKILYLAELDEFCGKADKSALRIKEIFGVTDEDANLMRIETLSGATEMESLEQLVREPSDEDFGEED
ncbi:unnamed protein product [Calypogeia fissa]